MGEFQKAHREWLEAASSGDTAARDDRWSESIAVGSESFVEQVKAELGFGAQPRQVAVQTGDMRFENERNLMATISIVKMKP